MKMTRRDPSGARTSLALLRLTQAYACSRLHSAEAKQAVERYGDGDGQPISGCVRSHFPEEVKNSLRGLALTVGAHLDDSLRSWRSAGRTRGTWLREKDRIRTRDGSGFYG